MRIAAIIAAFAVSSAFGEQSNPPPTGPNCDLSSPPAEAGEEMNHGLVLRIYPRAKDIDSRYTGCQVLFASDRNKWILVAMTEVRDGDPVRVWSPDTDSSMDCRFKAGAVLRGDPKQCPRPESLLLRSMAPGCVETIRAAVAKGGLGAPRPKNCDYQ